MPEIFSKHEIMPMTMAMAKATTESSRVRSMPCMNIGNDSWRTSMIFIAPAQVSSDQTHKGRSLLVVRYVSDCVTEYV